MTWRRKCARRCAHPTTAIPPTRRSRRATARAGFACARFALARRSASSSRTTRLRPASCPRPDRCSFMPWSASATTRRRRRRTCSRCRWCSRATAGRASSGHASALRATRSRRSSSTCSWETVHVTCISGTARPAASWHVSICRELERQGCMEPTHARRSLRLDCLSPRGGRKQAFGKRIEARARALAPDALHADARALDQEKELVGDLFGPRIARGAYELDQALALAPLVRLDHAACWVARLPGK